MRSYQNITPGIVNNFRLSLESANPVTTSDVTAATTIYCTPYSGPNISLYNGSVWSTYVSSEFSLALGTLTNALPYDVFCYANNGVPTLEFTAWSSTTVRATNLAYQDGILCKTGALTRRYLGTFYNPGNQSATVTMTIAAPGVISYASHGLPVNAPVVFTTNGALPTGITAGTTYYIANTGLTSGTFQVSATVGGTAITTTGSQSGTHTCTVSTYTEDSKNNRFLFNYYNSVPRSMRAPAIAANFNYTTLTYQPWEANLANKCIFMVGISESLVSFEASMARLNTSASILSYIGVGFNSITSATNSGIITDSILNLPANNYAQTTSSFLRTPAIGLNYTTPLQKSTATGACTWIAAGAKFEGVVQC